MDPNACLARIIYLNEQMGELRHASLITLAPFRSELDEACEDLHDWLRKGGFAPDTDTQERIVGLSIYLDWVMAHEGAR